MLRAGDMVACACQAVCIQLLVERVEAKAVVGTIDDKEGSRDSISIQHARPVNRCREVPQ